MLTLSRDELIELTGRTQKGKQVEALKSLGIPFKIRPDGTPVVLRTVMEVSLGHATANQGPSSPRMRVPEARRVLVREGR